MRIPCISRSSPGMNNMLVPQAKGWTEERRRRQAERIRMQKPWLHSTGPRTTAGKARSSRNARRHGLRSAEYLKQMKAIRQILRIQRQYLFLARQQVRLWERMIRQPSVPAKENLSCPRHCEPGSGERDMHLKQKDLPIPVPCAGKPPRRESRLHRCYASIRASPRPKP